MKNNPQLPYPALIKEFGLRKVLLLSQKYRSEDLTELDSCLAEAQMWFNTPLFLPF